MDGYRDRQNPIDALTYLRMLNQGEQLRWILESIYDLRQRIEDIETKPEPKLYQEQVKETRKRFG